MRIYTVHTRPPILDLDKDIQLIREGFSWMAFLFSVLWALSQRLWLVAIGIIVVEVMLSVLVGLLGIDAVGQAAVMVGFASIIGFVAYDLQRWTLELRGYLQTAIIAAASRDEAERRYFESAPSALVEARGWEMQR